MNKIYLPGKWLSLQIFLAVTCLAAILVSLIIPGAKAQNITEINQRVILIEWDGAQRNHFLELYDGDQLPNLKAMVEAGGLLRTDLIINTETCLEGSGDGYDLETGPANAAMHTGYGYPVMQNQDNRYPNPIPAGLTFYERLKQAYPEVKTGLVSNRCQDFWPLPALENAQLTMDYWWDMYSRNAIVTAKVNEFLGLYSSSPFFLFIHYVTPDNAGHALGENSAEYTNTTMDADTQLGLILAKLSDLGIAGSTTVLVTTDHGFDEDGFDHEACTDDNRDIWIAANDSVVIGNFDFPAYQTGLTPALFDIFGMDKNAVEPAFPSHSLYLMPDPTQTPTPTETPDTTLTPTGTLEMTPTPTSTSATTSTPTGTPENTSTPTETPLPTPTPTETPTPTTSSYKLVFVTGTTYSGNLGGLSGADQICQNVADQAGLPGTYKAWLSDSLTSVSSRIAHASMPYQRVDGVIIANNWSDLADGVLGAALSITESGEPVIGAAVWTNSKANGAIASTTNTCTDWGATNGQGYRGNDSSATRYWTMSGLLGCNYYLHLYCFQE